MGDHVTFPDGFRIRLHLFLIVDPSAIRDQGRDFLLELLQDAPSGAYVPMLTNEAEGEGMIRDPEMTGKRVLPVATCHDLWAALMRLFCDGLVYVAVDHRDGMPARLYPIKDVLALMLPLPPGG